MEASKQLHMLTIVTLQEKQFCYMYNGRCSGTSAGVRGRPARQPPGVPTCYRHIIITWIIENTDTLRSSTHKRTCLKIVYLGHTLSKIFASPVKGWKCLKSSNVKYATLLVCPRHPCLGLTLSRTHAILTYLWKLPQFYQEFNPGHLACTTCHWDVTVHNSNSNSNY